MTLSYVTSPNAYRPRGKCRLDKQPGAFGAGRRHNGASIRRRNGTLGHRPL